ncbi:hypothetical protein LJC61_02800 [Ruminococcaceae bacterium OttesenSCG-928-A16]|nr:hypothetical protein [Ruminococcaceae bacterium OttesenSCG-928-A16]
MQSKGEKAMPVRLNQFIYIDGSENGNVWPKDDATLYNHILQINGYLVTPEVSQRGANMIAVTSGQGIVYGRQFVIDEEDVLVPLSSSGAKQGRLIVRIDISNADNPIGFEVQSAATLPPLVQENFMEGGSVFEVPLATFTVEETQISNLAFLDFGKADNLMFKTTYDPNNTGKVLKAVEVEKAPDYLPLAGGPMTGNILWENITAGPRWTTADGTLFWFRAHAPSNTFKMVYQKPGGPEVVAFGVDVNGKGYINGKAGSADTVPWSGVTGKPSHGFKVFQGTIGMLDGVEDGMYLQGVLTAAKYSEKLWHISFTGIRANDGKYTDTFAYGFNLAKIARVLGVTRVRGAGNGICGKYQMFFRWVSNEDQTPGVGTFQGQPNKLQYGGVLSQKDTQYVSFGRMHTTGGAYGQWPANAAIWLHYNHNIYADFWVEEY